MGLSPGGDLSPSTSNPPSSNCPTQPPDYHGHHHIVERPTSLVSAGKWPGSPPGPGPPPGSHETVCVTATTNSTNTMSISSNSSLPPGSTSSSAASSSSCSSVCGGRHSRWLLCVSSPPASSGGCNGVGEQYHPSPPNCPPSPPSRCTLGGCFLRPPLQPLNLQQQQPSPYAPAPTPARSPSPHPPPGLPSPLVGGGANQASASSSPPLFGGGGGAPQNATTKGRTTPSVPGECTPLPSVLPCMMNTACTKYNSPSFPYQRNLGFPSKTFYPLIPLIAPGLLKSHFLGYFI